MRVFSTCAIAFLLVGCGSDDNGGAPDAAPEAMTEIDTGMPESGAPYPAFTIDAPQVTSLGGPVLTTPKVQPIFFPGFDYPTQLTDFTSKVGTSMWWSGLSEYKVGAIVSATPIALTSSQIVPADIGDITDSYIQSWLQARFDGTHPEFGTTPDPNTIYTLYYPTQTVISLSTGGPPPGDGGAPDGGGGGGGDTSCTGFGGYHDNVTIMGVTVPYAVIPECPTFGNLTGVDVITATSSHELAEASTDPYPSSNPAYLQVDDNHLAWMYFLGGGEVGDMCAQFSTSFYKPTDVSYMVQRTWSNAQATAGNDPCQPGDTSMPYFNTMPVFNDMVAVRGGGMTKGVVVPVGMTKPLALELYSNGPTSGPWTLSAKVYARGGTSAPVTTMFDMAQGENGDMTNLEIDSTGALTSTTKTATLVITSTLGSRQNLWIGYIGQ